ncbi:PocR ligand-binding domain-containing protein [Clostridium pasteurianum]|uniref:sensor histidine kinase n=1 Tax=Clostridium pasteurianum TaxID=1501 RepID=UPI00226102B3|nr:PocR ligand-binding domain-containing protein [Clostridium pasteurianum]UZW12620.1 PocR ligand-binding domain-containing protein [Clostridium pasteurianum]
MTAELLLKDIIKIKEFQKIQDDIANSMGISIITTDYRGKPITKHSRCTDFCKTLREDNNTSILCQECDSKGGLESVKRGIPYIYKCHMNIIDFAVPIIFKGQYLGALMAGQVLTEKSKLLELKNIISVDTKVEVKEELIEQYKKLSTIPYDKIKSIAQMLFRISNYIVDQGALKIVQQELNKKNIEFMEAEGIKTALEKELKDAQLKALQSQINPHFLFNILNSISALALIEGAPKTQEVVCDLSEILRYTLRKTNQVSQLGDEISYVKSYLNLQKIRFDSRLNFNITIEENCKNIKVPFMIIQPFVENSIIHGIETKESGGLIEINIYEEGNSTVIAIKDDGIGIDKNKLESINNINGRYIQNTASNGIGINNVLQRIDYFYGDKYYFNINSKKNKGTKVKIVLFK